MYKTSAFLSKSKLATRNRTQQNKSKRNNDYHQTQGMYAKQAHRKILKIKHKIRIKTPMLPSQNPNSKLKLQLHKMKQRETMPIGLRHKIQGSYTNRSTELITRN